MNMKLSLNAIIRSIFVVNINYFVIIRINNFLWQKWDTNMMQLKNMVNKNFDYNSKSKCNFTSIGNFDNVIYVNLFLNLIEIQLCIHTLYNFCYTKNKTRIWKKFLKQKFNLRNLYSLALPFATFRINW